MGFFSVMLYQAFTAADFSCCLFVALSAFSFVFSKWNAAWSGWDQEIDLAIAEYFTFLPSKTPGLLLLCFGSSSICTTFMKHRPIYFAAFGWIWADSISLYTEFFQLLLFSVTSSINTSNPVPLEAMHTHAITQLHVSQMMLYLDHLHTYFILQFWYRLLFMSAFQRMLLKKWFGYL